MRRFNIFKGSNEASTNRAPDQYRGFILIEAMIGIGIVAVMLVGFAALAIYTNKVNRSHASELKAALWLREAIEASKDLERTNWPAISDSLVSPCIAVPPCRPEIVGANWTLANGSETLDDGIFTRALSIEPVFRDQLAFPNVIVETPGVLDPDTKKVTASISWHNGFVQRTMTLETYVYHLP